MTTIDCESSARGLALGMIVPLDLALGRAEDLLDTLPIDDLPADAAVLRDQLFALREQLSHFALTAWRARWLTEDDLPADWLEPERIDPRLTTSAAMLAGQDPAAIPVRRGEAA
jgi:hypothetical protein